MQNLNLLTILFLAAVFSSAQTAEAADAKCELELRATIPITFVHDQPMVAVKINGKPEYLRFSLNYDLLLYQSTANTFGLSTAKADGKLFLGLGSYGSTPSVAKISQIEILDVVLKNIYVYVVDSIGANNEAGLYGTWLSGIDPKEIDDIEFDFAHGAVRLFAPHNCKDEQVVYWGGGYEIAPYIKNRFDVKIGSKTLKGSIFAGNEISMMTLEGARKAKLNLHSAGPLPMGMLAEAVVKPIDLSIANFPEISIGDEIIKNAALAVGDIFPRSMSDTFPEIILGSDFVRSHRIISLISRIKSIFLT